MRANRFLGSGGTLNKVFNCATLTRNVVPNCKQETNGDFYYFIVSSNACLPEVFALSTPHFFLYFFFFFLIEPRVLG